MNVPVDELEAVLQLVTALRPGVELGEPLGVANVGHGREVGDVVRAQAFIEAWTAEGGEVGATVSWPAVAASWLRPATRLTAGLPDVWVVADTAAGWSGMGPRLGATGRWLASRTVCFSGLADPTLPGRAGFEATDGLTGATADGRVWRFVHGFLRVEGAVLAATATATAPATGHRSGPPQM